MVRFSTNIFKGKTEEFFLSVINLYLPLNSTGRSKRIKVTLGRNQLNVEEAVARLLELSGYEVLSGDQVHFAGHVLTGKFMGINDHETFKNWGRLYGYDDSQLDSILRESDQLLRLYLTGDENIALQLLESLVERWDIYYKPIEKRKREIRILADFWINNKKTLSRWVQWYTKLAYDPGGAPDLFAWDRKSKDWSWLEVKSAGDSLNEKQWWWIHQFMTNVAKNVAMIRVLSHEV